ncbi:DUF2812 domain-containing protein [Cohnella mopanensis]|uniref:DUF2812 domain-containing protein n=1 Tax=Cohnella mopanensis TaxID=2911966 RepID=UPI001EF90D94|nr:DUF2812 domain-containing protein [Cohnella mopanensis]
MRKWKWFHNFDKEEKWLNELASQGYMLVRKSIGYEFQRVKPEKAIIRIDYRTFKNREDFEDYRALFEDSGWQHIAGTRSSGHQYFKKREESGNEDIFSDVDSKAARYKRMAQMWLSLASIFLPLFAVLVSTGAIDAEVFLNPKALYYTPGLWEKAGTDFWGAFLFETPFALLRGFLWILLPLTLVLYVVFAFKANRRYRNDTDQ